MNTHAYNESRRKQINLVLIITGGRDSMFAASSASTIDKHFSLKSFLLCSFIAVKQVADRFSMLIWNSNTNLLSHAVLHNIFNKKQSVTLDKNDIMCDFSVFLSTKANISNYDFGWVNPQFYSVHNKEKCIVYWQLQNNSNNRSNNNRQTTLNDYVIVEQ